MAVFEQIEVEWRGKKYTIPATRVLRTIARVEEYVTSAEIAMRATQGRFTPAKLSEAMGVVLHMAGAGESSAALADEFYKDILSIEDGDELARRGIDTLLLLASLMTPPEILRKRMAELSAGKDDAADGKAQAPAGPSLASTA